jgi:hypothetical protein
MTTTVSIGRVIAGRSGVARRSIPLVCVAVVVMSLAYPG